MNLKLPLNQHGFEVSQLVMGCMGLGGDWNRNSLTAEDIMRTHAAVDAALSIMINMFDHADIYSSGKGEEAFGRVLKERPGLRDTLVVQSKCGICPPSESIKHLRFDSSKAHIMSSVESILRRLGIEKLDILLLHRPDPLVEPEEVADAFRQLKMSGKVRSFGVSNMSEAQMKLLQAYLDEPLVVNQLELSLFKRDWLDAVVSVNAGTPSFPEGTIEYCRLAGVQLQSWGPLARGQFSGNNASSESPTVQQTAAVVARLAKEKEVAKEAIVLSFLLRHPARIQPVIGTTNPERIKACGDSAKVALTREEWYELYMTSKG